MSAYGFRDEQYDQRVRDADPGTAGNQQIIAFVAASNDGPTTGSIGSPAGGKNVITVGSVQNYMPDSASYGNLDGNVNNPDAVSSFSSRGWMDDGRIKPDIVTPGIYTWCGIQ